MVKRDRDRDRLFERIVRVLGEMPDQLAQAFILSHYRGLSIEQISREVGVRVGETPQLLEQANSLFYQKIGASPGEARSCRSNLENGG
jgi:DNA-directed RNA polymerase specialized sigma24 family protein